MIVYSIENGPYVRRMIATPGEPDHLVPVPESLYKQTDKELTETDINRMDADDQAIQTILLGLPKDVYAVVDSYETAKEIWERNVGGNGENEFGQYAGQVAQNQQGFNAWQNGGIQGAQNAGLRLLIAQKEEARIQLQTEEFDFMDVAGLPSMTQMAQLRYILITTATIIRGNTRTCSREREKMRLLKKEIKPANYAKINHLSGVFVPQTTKSKEELFLSNFSNMVTVSKMIYIPNEDLSDDTTPSVARKFLNEVKSSLVTLQRVVKQKMTLEVHNWSSSAHKEVHIIISHEITPIINQVDARVQNFEIQFLQEAAKFVQDFKSLAKEADESLDKQKSLELEIERLLKASASHDIMSIVQNSFEKEYDVLWNNWYTKCEECKYDKILYDKAYNDMQQKVERLQAQLRDLKGKSSNTPSASNTLDPLNQKFESKIVEQEFQVVNYEREISNLTTTYKNMFDSIKSNRAHARLHDLIFKNAKLRARLFEKTSESMKTTSGTSVTSHDDKPKFSAVTPLSKKLHASMPSHSVPQPREFNFVKHKNMIAPEMFKIILSQMPRVDLVPNKQSSASIRTKPITNSQRHVIVKENVSSNMATASSIGLVHTARTRRPQPKGNTRNVRVPSASKSSEVKKSVTVEDHRRTTKDETPEVIKNFLKKIYVRLQAPVIIVRTDNGTEFKNQVLKEYFDSVGITHETFAAKTPQ
nr:integrase, catalytic region, zinc finger, CCHC-type, peptidase aspartic, catalytic [Tanacetum cinerariifolium]